MDISSQNLLLWLVLGVPLGIGGVLLFVKGMKKTNRFFYHDYGESKSEQFKDVLLSSVYLFCGVCCLAVVGLAFIVGAEDVGRYLFFIPAFILFGAFVIPVSILGSYWQLYLTKKMWGGFLPTIRAIQGYDQPETNNPQQVDLSKVKLPKRVIHSAVAIALVVFFGLILLVSNAQWDGPSWLGILLLILLPGLFSFGIFMAITTTSLSRRIERMRNGELVDEE